MDNLIITSKCEVETIDGKNSANGSNIVYLYDRPKDKDGQQIIFEYCYPDLDTEFKAVAYAVRFLQARAYHNERPIIIQKHDTIRLDVIRYDNRSYDDYLITFGRYQFFWDGATKTMDHMQELVQGLQYIITDHRGY